tara:strand:- start:222 stop:503 length:282 start_codon:yes stop_codon:yes gene_type:complete
MIYMPTVTMSMEEYLALVQGVEMMKSEPIDMAQTMSDGRPAPKKRVSTRYAKTYKREFRKISARYKTKSGKWKKDGFKTAVKAAHRATRKILG